MPRTKKEEDTLAEVNSTKTTDIKVVLEELLKNPDAITMLKEKLTEGITEGHMLTASAESAEKVTVINFWDCKDGIEVSVPYGNGMIRRFSAFGEKHTMPVSEFELFASSPVGSNLLKQRILGIGGECPDYIARNIELKDGNADMVTINMLNTLLDKSEDEILYIVSELCDFHKSVIKTELEKAVLKNDSRVSRDLLVKLDKQNPSEGGVGMFRHLINLYDEQIEKS